MSRCSVHIGIRLLLPIRHFISSFFFLSHFQTLKCFVTLFSGGLEDWNLVHTWTMGGFIVFTGIRLLLLICPIYFFIFLSLQFSNITIFRYTFRRNCEAWKIETWYTCGQWADVWCITESGCCSYLSHYSVFFLSNFQTFKFFVTLFSGTVRPRLLRLGAHIDNGWMYRVYRNQAAAAYLSLYFFIFLSLQFSNIKIESDCCCLFVPLFLHFSSSPIFDMKIFRHTFLRNCEA